MKAMYLIMTLILLIGLPPSVKAAIYEISTGVDQVSDNGECSLREALMAAFSQSAVDTCPAGDADSNTINLLTSVGTYDFNGGAYVVPAGTVPSLSINSNASNEASRPVINLGLNNRFMLWPDFVDEQLSVNRVTFFFGKDADGLGGGVFKLEGETVDNEATQAELNVLETTFLSNQSDADGGALHLTGEIRLVILHSLFQGNQADAGAAIHFNNTGLSRNLTIRGTDFLLNTSDTGDGALHVIMDTLNSPSTGGYPRFSLSQSTFDANTADGLGGIAGADLSVKNVILTIDNTQFTDNIGSGLSAQLLENTSAARPFDTIRINALQFKDNFINTLGPGVFQMHLIRTGFAAVTGTFPAIDTDNVLMYQTGTPVAGGIRVVDDVPLSGVNRQVGLHGWTVVGHATALVSFHPEQQGVQVIDSILYDNNTNTAGDSSPELINNLIDIDPLFETAYGNDFYPSIDSPAVDQSNSANQGFPNNQFQRDLLSHPRIIGPFKDLGAVERQAVNELTVTVSGPGTVELFGGSFSDCDASTSPCVYAVPSELGLTLIGRGIAVPEHTVWQGHCNRTYINGASTNCAAGNMNDDVNAVAVFFDDVIFASNFD